MQAARAAKGHQCELSRIVAALNRDHADGFFHGCIDHTNDSAGKLFGRQVRSISLEPLGDKPRRALEIKSEFSSQKALRLQTTEQKIGVRHRGLSPTAITDWTRIGSGRFRAHAQSSAGVKAGYRAPSGAYGVDVEHGHTDRKTGDLGLAAGASLTIHQRNIGGSSAHIERDDALETVAARHGGGAYDPARRS